MLASKNLKVGLISLLFAFISNAVGSSFAKLLFPFVGPAATTAYRLCISAVVISMICRPWRYSIKWSEFKWILAYGICLAGMNIFFYFGIERIPLGIALAIEFLGPLTLSIISSRRYMDLLWIALCMTGLAILTPWNEGSGLDLVGILFVLSAGAFWAMYIVFGQKTTTSHPSQVVSFGIIIAACISLPLVFLTSDLTVIFEPNYLMYGCVIALLSSLVPYSLDMVALRHLPRFLYAIFLSLSPIVATLFGMIILKEYLTLSQALAFSLMVSGCAGSSISFVKNQSISKNKPIVKDH